MERFLVIFASFLVNFGPILGRFHAIASKVPNLEIPKNARVSPVFTWFFINFRSFHFVSVSDTISVPTTSLKQGRHLGAAGSHLGLSPLIGVHVSPKGGRGDPALGA